MRIPSAPYPTAPHHESIVVAAPCAGQQGTCIQLPEDVFLQALVHKDVGRHKARPLQLTMVWCGRSNERPYELDEVGIFNKSLIIILLYDACERSNERPYLSVVRVFADCAVGEHCCVGTETVPILRQQHNYTLNVGTYLGASASGETLRYIIFYPAHHGTSLRAKVQFDLCSPVTPVAAPCICNPHRASFSKMILVCGGLFLYKIRIHRPQGTFRVRCGWDVVEMF